MLPDTKHQVEDGRNTTAIPELPPEAVGGSAAVQERGQLSELFGTQSSRGLKSGRCRRASEPFAWACVIHWLTAPLLTLRASAIWPSPFLL